MHPLPPRKAERAREPFDSTNGESPPAEITGPGRRSPEAIALGKWAEDLGTDRNMEPFAYWAVEACDLAPAKWVRLLLEHKVKGRSGSQRAAIPLLSKILGDWRRDRRCPLEQTRASPGRDPEPGTGPQFSAEDEAYVKQSYSRTKKAPAT